MSTSGSSVASNWNGLATSNGRPIEERVSKQDIRVNHSFIDRLPATLDLYNGLASPGDADILKVALELGLHPRNWHKRPGAQDSVDSARLLHGLWLGISLETSELERSVAKGRGDVRSFAASSGKNRTGLLR